MGSYGHFISEPSVKNVYSKWMFGFSMDKKAGNSDIGIVMGWLAQEFYMSGPNISAWAGHV